MESFHISSELIEEGNDSKFGNMKVFNNGWNVINTKMVGLYVTIALLFSNFAFLSLLV